MSPDEEYSDTFAADTAAEIGNDLFDSPSTDDGLGKGETVNEEVVESTPSEPVQASPETPPAVIPGQNSVSRPLPKSWKKEMAPLWEKADPALHEYVYAREADVMRGIQQYQTGYQQWDSLIKPFAPVFQNNPSVNPVQIMQGLMNTHLQFLNPSLPGDKKLQLAKNLLSEYGIDLGDVPMALADGRLVQLEQRLAAQEQQQRQAAQSAYDAGVAAQQRVVETFAKDPKNKYFDEVGNDIFRFIQTGAATDLASAYELACYANPAVRAKILAEQQAAAAPKEKARNGKGQFVNIEGDETPKPKIVRGTIDSTIDGIVNSYFSKH